MHGGGGDEKKKDRKKTTNPSRKRKAMMAMAAQQREDAAMIALPPKKLSEPCFVDNMSISARGAPVVLSSNILADEMRSTCIDPEQQEKRSKFIELVP